MSKDKAKAEARRLRWLKLAAERGMWGVPLHVQHGFAYDNDAERCVQLGLLVFRRMRQGSWRGNRYCVSRLFLTSKGRAQLEGVG
jgi:hypothetical protein